MRRVLPVALAVLMLAWPLSTQTQAADDAGQKNAKQARAALDAMVQALGGQAWLTMKNQMRQGQLAAFFHGKPSGGTTEYWEYHAWPDQDRIEFTKHRDVVQFYLGRAGWEVTFEGKKALPQEQVDDFLRRRDHSIETAVKSLAQRSPHHSGLRGPAPGRAPPGRSGDPDLGRRTRPSPS